MEIGKSKERISHKLRKIQEWNNYTLYIKNGIDRNVIEQKLRAKMKPGSYVNLGYKVYFESEKLRFIGKFLLADEVH